ncbi:UDP-N-acetylmuramoyl-tripeptide--D-alanyl-D-alanine ligase [candidate division KSB1 bacterium]|nr:UDP-N-acetylmuramoyl-tripeptide--D-alanyl-D-alanine ligase [candidate division KSB1 bacterium]
MDLLFSELLKIKNFTIEFRGDHNILSDTVPEILIDSRKISHDSIYIAIRGERLDGHQFVSEAFAKGAGAVICDEAGFKKVSATSPEGNYFIVSDTTLALQEIAHYYRQKFSMPVLALTGTSGKTTTKEMIGTVLDRKFNILKTSGNLNNHIGVPLTLLQLNKKQQIAIIEIGTNHFGEIKTLTAITNPDIGLITNIGRGHLEFFGSIEGVGREKTDLFRGLKSGGKAIINIDDPFLAPMTRELKNYVDYGIKNNARLKGKFLRMSELGNVTFMVENQEIALQVPGIHNIYNALAAVAVGLEFEIPFTEIKDALEAFKSQAKRMETLQLNQNLILNDCYNANPDSTAAALEVLNGLQGAGRKIAVLGDMLELGEQGKNEHFQIGAKVAQLKIDYFLGFGPLTKLGVEEASKQMGDRAMHFQRKSDLIQCLKELIQTDDVLLIKGSRGMAMEEVTEAVLTYLKS